MTLYIGCDHAGFELKKKVISLLPNIEWKDMGTHSCDSVDYPDYADLVCKSVTQAEKINQKNEITDSRAGGVLGILICGSGQGMAIRANRFPQIRAALCWNSDIARLAREHNNANILAISAISTPADLAKEMIQIFIATSFEGGRHQKRVEKLSGDTGC
jgi:ribose 5-phosphate isomerase B